MLPSCTSLEVGGHFWYSPSVEMSLKPWKHQCEDVCCEEAVGLTQLSCVTAAGHCTQVPAASPGPAPGRLWAPPAVLAAAGKQLLSRIV